MFEDLMLKVMGALLVVGIFIVFWLKGEAQASRQVDLSKDFVLPYQVSILPTLLSIIGVFVFFGGALQAAMGSETWIGVVVAAVGVLCIWYRFYSHRKYIFKPGGITCIRGRRSLGEFHLSEIKRFVRIDYAGGITLLGLETASEAPEFMPRPSIWMKTLLIDYPGVSVVFSSEGGRVHAEALLKELQARMSTDEPVTVETFYHSLDVS